MDGLTPYALDGLTPYALEEVETQLAEQTGILSPVEEDGLSPYALDDSPEPFSSSACMSMSHQGSKQSPVRSGRSPLKLQTGRDHLRTSDNGSYSEGGVVASYHSSDEVCSPKQRSAGAVLPHSSESTLNNAEGREEGLVTKNGKKFPLDRSSTDPSTLFRSVFNPELTPPSEYDGAQPR